MYSKLDKDKRGKLMNRKHHHINVETGFFRAIQKGFKTFLLTKNNNSFQYFDLVTIREVINGVETDQLFGPVEINYIFYGPEEGEKTTRFGLSSGYCVFCWNSDLIITE